MKPTGFNYPTKLVVNNSTLKDSESIAWAFNKHFSNIGRKLANEIPPVHTDPQVFLGPSLGNSFVLLPVTSTEVEDVITSLYSFKASSPCSIPVYLLKLIKTCISFPLQFIYNLSFSSGCVPEHFKQANVIPIHEKGSVTFMNHYRPICLLSIFDKILEQLVHKRIVKFIDQYNILYVNQFGLREKHPTMHATLLITDKIQRAIEDGLFSCGIFLDFSKAFGTVDHSILIRKLSHYGIRGIANDWFASYLHVSIGSAKSDNMVITHGVPRGFVLGPLLFLLYINDFNNCSKLFDFHIFADDTNLFYSNRSLSELEDVINNHLKFVSNWLMANKLSLNVEKTNFIIFHPPLKSQLVTQSNYQLPIRRLNSKNLLNI